MKREVLIFWVGLKRQRACCIAQTERGSLGIAQNFFRLILSNDNNYILLLPSAVFESDPRIPQTRAAKTNLLSTLFYITPLSVHEMSFSSAATSKRGRESQWERGGSREDNIEAFGVMRVRQVPSAVPQGNHSWRRNHMLSFLIKDVNYILMSERDYK